MNFQIFCRYTYTRVFKSNNGHILQFAAVTFTYAIMDRLFHNKVIVTIYIYVEFIFMETRCRGLICLYYIKLLIDLNCKTKKLLSHHMRSIIKLLNIKRIICV